MRIASNSSILWRLSSSMAMSLLFPSILHHSHNTRRWSQLFFPGRLRRSGEATKDDSSGSAPETLPQNSTGAYRTEDLKDMHNSKSAIYSLTVKLGIPDGMARRFKTELARFKETLKLEREVANNSLSMLGNE